MTYLDIWITSNPFKKLTCVNQDGLLQWEHCFRSVMWVSVTVWMQNFWEKLRSRWRYFVLVTVLSTYESNEITVLIYQGYSNSQLNSSVIGLKTQKCHKQQYVQNLSPFLKLAMSIARCYSPKCELVWFRLIAKKID